MVKKLLKRFIIFAMLCMFFWGCTSNRYENDRLSVETEVDDIFESQGYNTLEPTVEQRDNENGIRCFESNIELQEWIDCGDKSSLTSVFIQGDITKIPDEAFLECDQLCSAHIGDTVRTIGEKAFYGCTNIEEITFTNGLEVIGDWAFYGTAVKEVAFPESLRRIGVHAFSNCGELETVLFPTKMESVETDFWNCPSLRSITLPEEMEILAGESFAFCDGISELTIPKGIYVLEDGVAHDSSIKRIIFEGRLRAIVRLLSEEYPDLQQLVFLDGPPLQEEDVLSEYAEDELWDGIVGCESVTVYYLREENNLWTPNGETEWNGFPLVGIDSLDDLPPLAETTSMSLYHGGTG